MHINCQKKMLPSKTIFLKTLDGIKPDVLMADLVKYDQQLQNLTLLNERDKQFDLKRYLVEYVVWFTKFKS